MIMPRKPYYMSILQIYKIEAQKKREQEKKERKLQRQQVVADKEIKQKYIDSRLNETEDLNKELSNRLSELNEILEYTIYNTDNINFDILRINNEFQEFTIPSDLQVFPKPPQLEDFLSRVKEPSSVILNIPEVAAKYKKDLQEAQDKYYEVYKKDLLAYENACDLKIQKLREEYDKNKQDFELKQEERNHEINELENGYQNGDPTAIVSYFNLVLEGSSYPDGFPQEFRIAYVPESKELVIEYELPGIEIVPIVSEFRYIKTRDVFDELPRKAGILRRNIRV